jgi:hypothetical protein
MRKSALDAYYRNTYGLSKEQCKAIQKSQDNRCAICGEKPKKGKRPLFIDHCHKTGKVRAALCSSCNTMLGMAKDRATNLRAAAAYLERNKGA